MSSFQEYYPRMRELADYLLNNPELGYKEYKTSEAIEEAIHEITPMAKAEHFCNTGIKVVFNNHQTKTIGIIAELDSLYQPGHRNADSETGAAQACGHYTQVTIALAIMNELVKNKRIGDFGANLAFIFTPAEEFVDLEWRKKQKAEGKITYFGGKQEAIKLSVFDDVDYCVSVHAIGENFDQRTIEINCDLAGFNFQYFDFLGKASHAAFAFDTTQLPKLTNKKERASHAESAIKRSAPQVKNKSVKPKEQFAQKKQAAIANRQIAQNARNQRANQQRQRNFYYVILAGVLSSLILIGVAVLIVVNAKERKSK